MNLVNCLLFSISMHSPCLSAPPSSFNYSPSFARFLFPFIALHFFDFSSFNTHTLFLSFHEISPRFLSLPGFKPAFNVSPRLNVEGWKHKDGRHGGWECPLTLGIGETEIKKGRNIPRSDFNFRRRRLKGDSDATNDSRSFLEIRVNERYKLFFYEGKILLSLSLFSFLYFALLYEQNDRWIIETRVGNFRWNFNLKGERVWWILDTRGRRGEVVERFTRDSEC